MTARSPNVGPVETVIVFTAFIAATYGFGIYLFPALSESLRAEIGFSYREMGLVTGAVQIGFLASALAAGFLTLRIGAIPLILMAIATCAACLVGVALSGSLYALAVFLVVLGGCASLIWVPMVEVARETIHPSARGKALGLMSSGTGYGVFLNSALLAIALPVTGWRNVWIIVAALTAVLAAYAMFRFRGTVRELRERRRSPAVSRERAIARLRSAPRSLVGSILVIMFLNGFSCMSFQTFLSSFMIGELRFSDSQGAAMWAIMGVIGMFSGFLVGALADRITIRRGLAVACLTLCLASASAAFACPLGIGKILAFSSAALFGMSFYSVFGLVPAYISHKFEEGSAAIVFAIGSVCLGLGGALGNVIGGYSRDGLGSFVPLYGAIAAAALLSAIIAARLPPDSESGR